MRDQRIHRKGQSPDHLALGFAIREARARRGISQEELGFRSTLHRNYVGAIERGEINPTFRILMKVSSGLGVELSALVALYERHLAEAGQ
jgi:transcriptional regulator with XRE-family HTH domain